MALTEFQRRMNEKYNPNAYKTRKDLFLTPEQIEQKAEERRQQNAATHLAVRALLLHGESNEVENVYEDTKPTKISRRKKKKKKSR